MRRPHSFRIVLNADSISVSQIGALSIRFMCSLEFTEIMATSLHSANNRILSLFLSLHFHHRNAMLMSSGHKLPKFTKTGTTIAGIVFDKGVVLGADTRATSGPIVAQKNCEKIHYIAPNIYCCGAGTAADTENVTEMISSQLTLMRLNTSSQSRVVMALTRLKRYLFRYGIFHLILFPEHSVNSKMK